MLDDMASDDLQWSADIESVADSLFIYQDLLRDTLLFATELTSFNFDIEDTNIDFQDNNEDYYWQH